MGRILARSVEAENPSGGGRGGCWSSDRALEEAGYSPSLAPSRSSNRALEEAGYLQNSPPGIKI